MRKCIALSIAAMAVSSAVLAAGSVSQPKALRLTVYNSNFALVKDVRSINLQTGLNSIDVVDVAARIDATSVLFKSLTSPNSVGILEQNYQYDLITPDNILNKSVGKRITFTTFDETGKPHTQSGTLLNPATTPNPNPRPDYDYGYNYQPFVQSGGLVVKMDDGKVVLRPAGQISVESMPTGLRPKPTLNWLLRSALAGAQDAEISYITDGINWKADYVALVNANDSMLDLNGWVTLDNRSGATYKDAKLTLMAGDVRRVQDDRNVQYKAARRMDYAMDDKSGSQFQEKSFSDYHMYTMERPTTIADNETKQLSLLNASSVPVTKEYIYDGRQQWWRNWWYPGRVGDPGGGYDTSNYHKVNIVLQIINSKQNHMGMPLPKGKIRVYKLDDTGSQQFIGEDQIDHTPKDEKVRLYIGDAFDVVGDYKRSDYKKIASNVIEETFEVVLRNHKETPVTVRVVDHVWSDWQVTAKSHAYNKKDAHTIEFPVKVAKDGTTKVTYTIRTKW